MIDATLFDDASVVPVPERCRYPSKFCRNRRSLKRNGELHRFCDHHRAKANLNQKRWSKNRRGGAAFDVKHEPPTTPPLNEFHGVDEPSFTSFLTMLQPQPFDATQKTEMHIDDQFGAFLPEFMESRDDLDKGVLIEL